MPFDFDGYLANKAAANDKIQAVIDASNAKVSELKAYDASKAPAPTSWADQLGLTPGGFVANRVNDAASLVSGAARVAGQVASLPVSLLGEDQTHAAQPGDIDAYNRYVTGKATPDDVARLNFQPESGNPTLLQRFQTAEAARGTARAISDAFDLTGIVNQQNRQGLQTDLAKGFQPNWDKVQSGEAGQMISGLVGLLVNAGSALLQNPSAVREHILENIPQLFVGAAGKAGQAAMAASNVGYAVDEFQKGLENYAKANGGALPPAELQQTMALQAASLALAEQVGDVVGLRAAKAAVGDAARTGFMQSMKGVLKAGAQGVATEAPTEGFQTYMEGQIEGTPKSAQEIYDAAVIGGASGGGLTAGGRTVAELAGATPEQVAVRNTAAEKAAVLDEAIQSGDVTNLTNPKSKDYAPAQAIAALYGNSQLDTTDDATKQANVQRADVILAELEKQRAVVAANQLDPDKRQATIDDLKRRLSVQTDPEMKEIYQQEIADLEAIAAKPVDKAEVRARQAKLEKLDAELVQARQSRYALGVLVMPKEQVEGSLKALQDPARVADHVAEADKVITLAMAAPGRVDPKTAAALADDTQNGLTDAQRGYLRQFSDARLAALKLMDMGEVSQAIYFGDKKKGDVGIAEYRAGITAAIAAGDRKSAYRQISALQRFSDSHTGKAAAANGAKAQGFGSQIHRTKTGEWVVASPAENLWPADLQRNGGLAIKSSELVSNINDEADAISATAEEMRSAYALKFTNPGANDVQNSTQQGQDSQPRPEVAQAEDPAKAGQSSNEAGEGTVPDTGAGDVAVQADGVELKDGGRITIQTTPAPGAFSSLNRMAHGEPIALVASNEQGEEVGRLIYMPNGGPIDSFVREQDRRRGIASALYDAYEAAGGKLLSEESGAVISEEARALRKSRTVAREAQTKGTSGSSESSVAVDSTAKSSGSTVENQSTEEITVEQQPNADGTLTSAGQLSSLTEKSPEGMLQAVQQQAAEKAEFNEKLLGDFVTQDAGREDSASKRPLVMVKDFLSKLDEGVVQLQDYLKKTLTDPQRAAIDTFMVAVSSWVTPISQNLPKPQADKFRYQDMISFLIEPKEVNGKQVFDVEENVKTAMAAAIFAFVSDSVGRSAINTDSDINNILGRSADAYVSWTARQKLGMAGAYQHTVIDSLGTKIIDALGLKARKDAGQDLLPRLRTALGGQALKLMEDKGIVRRTTIDNNTMTVLRRDEDIAEVTSGGLDHTFFALARDKELQPIGLAKRIAEATRGSGNVLQNLFGIETGAVMPSLEPIQQMQKSSDTGMGIPGLLRTVLKQKQTNEQWRVNKDPMAVLAQFEDDDDLTLQMIGVKEITEQNTHIYNERSRKAKNDGLIREFELFSQFVGEHITTSDKGMDQEFFLKYDMWKQQRVGIETTAANPQSSKIHRWLMGSPEWETTIALNDKAALDSFMLRVAEGFGVKTERSLVDVSVRGLKERMQEPGNAKAVTALQAVIFQKGGKLTDEQKKDITAAVTAGKEKLHTLSALIAWARYAEALQKGEKEFTTSLVGEVDGVANGTMLNSVLYGAGESEARLLKLLERGGMFTEQSGVTQYNQYRARPGARDIYEDTAAEMFGFINWMEREGKVDPAVIAAIWNTAGVPLEDGTVTKDGRDMVKGALNPLNFGSGFKAILNGMASTYLEGIYAGFEKLSIAEANQEQVNLFVNSINVLLKTGGAQPIPVGKPISFYMRNTFDFKQERVLMDAHKEVVGYAAQKVVERNFSTFLERRKQMTDATQLTFDLYNAAYQALREEYIDKVGIPRSKNGTPIHDLSAEQEKEFQDSLREIAPLMDTAMSRDDNEINNGILLAKKERSSNSRAVYETVVRFGSSLTTGARQLTAKVFTVQQAPPGPLAISASTHSLDSRISHLTQRGRHILNIHDAVADGIGRLTETAREFNHNTYDTLMGYSPLRAAHVSLARVVQGLAKMQEEGTLSPAAVQAIKQMLQQRSERSDYAPKAGATIPMILSQTFAAANEADTMKYGVLAKLVSMDQYAFFGGNYEVTEANQAEAQAALKALPKKQDTSIDKAVDTLQKVLFETPAKATAVGAVEGLKPTGTGERSESAPADSVSDPESAGFNRESTADIDEDTIPNKTSPFGTLGESNQNDPAIVSYFNQNPKTTAKAVLEFLYRHLSGQTPSPTRDYSIKLTRALSRILPASLPVQLITPQTQASDVLSKPDVPVRGWFSSSKSKGMDVVYMVGQGFAQSALQPEVVLHELVHAATTHRLDAPESKPYKAELESILEAVRGYVKERNLSGYDAALSSVDELIAWGMTNQKFQQLVLAQVKFQSRTTSKLGNALQAFVATLSRLLGFKDIDSANALGALIGNVSALFEQQATATQNKTLSMAAEVNTYSTLDILNGLNDGKGTLSQAFQEQLRSVLDGIVKSLHGPFGSFKAALMKDQALSPMDVWLKALATGEAPFASTIMASGLKITSQEAFAIEQVEATVRSALNSSETRTKVAYRQLAELYTEVYHNVKAQDFHSGDWSKATDAEKAKANELYEFVFKLEKSSGDRSDYLARFAALGLGHQGFNQVLQRATERNTRKVSDAQTFAERLQIVFENILDFFRSKITSTYAGQKADVKLRTLVSQLVDIEAKNRFFIATEVSKTTLVEKLEDVGKGLNKKLSGAAEKILNSSWLRNNSSGMIQGAGGVARTIVGNRVDEFMDVISRIRDKHVKERHGAWMSLVGEAVGPNEQAKFLLLGTKHNEKLRKDIIDAVSNTALSVFANGGQDMTDEAKAAITQAFMRSGAHTLLDHYTMAQIEGLLIDPKQLAAAIRQIEGQLTGNAREYYIHQARALGYFKITGKVTSQKMMSNAGNIARMFATPYRGKISEEVAATAQKSLEPLVSLYALSYLSPGTQAQAAAVLKAENARTDGNGVEFVLKLHRQLENESRDRLFQGSNALMVHGYTPEILNPYTDIQIASDVKDPVTGKSDGDELQDRGWSKGAMAPVDPADPDRDRRHMYVLRGAGLGARQTGIISWTNMANKGSQKHSGYLNPANQNGLANAQLNASVMNARQAAVQKMFTAGASFDPTKVGTTYMAPIVNPQGDIVNWRYLMQEDTKDQLLERDNRFEHILGALAGSIFDKETTAEQNKKAMQALKEQHDAERSKQADRYIWVGADSQDEDLRETWALLPDVTKQDVKTIWGGEGVFVRKDSLDIVFGYRKLSAAKKIVDSLDARQKLAEAGLPSRVWDLDSQEFNTLQKLAIISMETMLTVWARTRGMNQERAEAYSKRAATMITRGGRLWSEAVAETKDLIVVKTGTTLLGNIWSNLSTLVINGVPWKDIIHHHSVALKGATAYHADSDELQRLKLLLDSGHTLGKENQIRRDILRLEDSIARNPITKLVDAGLMPTIVEDIASEEDIYSYKSALVRKTESVTSQLPDSIRNLAKTVYMTHDTPLYQGLSRVTQLSDFVARYTLYQHLVNRKINPLTEKDALSRAVDSFIMYDVPMHPMLQYADDTGLFMFTKYFLRIQRVLRTMWMDNPARTLSALLLDNTMGLGPIVLDSAAALRIGNNPLESGAFKFFGSLDELMTIKPVMSVFGGSSGGNWK